MRGRADGVWVDAAARAVPPPEGGGGGLPPEGGVEFGGVALAAAMPLGIMCVGACTAVGLMTSAVRPGCFVFLGGIGYVLTNVSLPFLSYPPTAHVLLCSVLL